MSPSAHSVQESVESASVGRLQLKSPAKRRGERNGGVRDRGHLLPVLRNEYSLDRSVEVGRWQSLFSAATRSHTIYGIVDLNQVIRVRQHTRLKFDLIITRSSCLYCGINQSTVKQPSYYAHSMVHFADSYCMISRPVARLHDIMMAICWIGRAKVSF